MKNQNKTLAFRVSSGLKNIIGRDLISDKYIAIFELVKNSYDAGATKVTISFLQTDNGDEKIVISDDGIGMTYDDIINKWLFVAYSAKKVQNRKKPTFRDKVGREFAGAKGVGRFSCDSLGKRLILLTKTEKEKITHEVEVNWANFEVDDTKEFINIPVKYSEVKESLDDKKNGTTLIVENLREEWSRNDLLRLKRSLMKLINPDNDKTDDRFVIEMIVPREIENDKRAQQNKDANINRTTVNGVIQNDIFEKLNIKTTCIEVNISSDGKEISTSLTDRGEYIFNVIERNRKYAELHDIYIKVFYLNQAAKLNFTHQMKVTPKDYGSVFIYKNGFRVNPYGEAGQDFFGVDQRKAQGWKRFLGTREIMGRIIIKGENNQFIETTSRAHGFIQTKAVATLTDFFVDKVLKVLEKYVVNLIGWGEPLKNDFDHVIMPNEIGYQIVSQFISNIDQHDVISVDYNPDILSKSERGQETLATSIKKLENVAEQTKNLNLINLAKMVKQHTTEIASQNIELEKQNVDQEKKLAKAKHEEKVREKQIYFLQGSTNQNVKNLINGFHSVYTLADATKGFIEFLTKTLLPIKIDDKKKILSILTQIYQTNEKIHKLSDLAIHGNQSLKQKGDNSIYDFLKQYINAGFAIQGLKYEISETEQAFNCKFDPSSIGVIVDNIASNSLKAGATVLNVSFGETSKYVEISFSDNGSGLDQNIKPDSIFEWGFSSNEKGKGFGIGLYHVKELVDEMAGSVMVDKKYCNGFRLIVRLKK